MSVERAEWHADEDALRALVEGSVGQVVAASLEAHVMRCPDCRGRLNTLAFDDPLETTWAAIRDVVEAPSPKLMERLLHRTGFSEETCRLLAAVPAMRGSWVLGVVFALVFAGAASLFGEDVGTSLFLLVAPLAPVVGVAAAFGGDADPSHEIVVTTPYSAGRLLLLRTAAVLVTCAPVGMLVGLALPGPAWLTVAWLSPAAAGVAVTLALSPAIGLTPSATTVGVVWSAVSLAASRAYDPLALVGPASQLVCLSIVVVSVAAILSKSASLDLPRRQ